MKKLSKESDELYCDILWYLGLNQINALNYNSALKSLLELKVIKEKIYGDNYELVKPIIEMIALVYINIQNYEVGIDLLRQSANKTKEKYGEASIQHASALMTLSSAYTLHSEFRKASQICDEVIKIYEILNLEAYYPISQDLYSIGQLKLLLGDYDTALKYFSKCRENSKMFEGDLSLTHAHALMGIATVLNRIGSSREGLEIIDSALDHYGKLLGTQNPTYASVLNIKGLILLSLGFYEKAHKCFSQSILIFESKDAEINPYYPTVLLNTGILLIHMSNFDSALVILSKAKTIASNIYGGNDFRYAKILDALGTCYEKLENLRESEKYHVEALRIFSSIWGDSTSDVAIVLSNLGTVNRKLFKYSKSISYYSRSLSILKNNHGVLHPDYLNVQSNYALSLIDNKNFAEAEQVLLNTIDGYKKIKDSTSYGYAKALNNIGSLYLTLNNNQKALEYIEKAVSALIVCFGDKHRDVASSLFNLAYLNKNIGNFQKALEIMLRTISIDSKLDSLKGTKYLDNLLALIDILNQSNKTNEVQKYAHELENFLEKNGELSEIQSSRALNTLGIFYSSIGNYNKAEEYIKLAITKRNKVYNEKSIDSYLLNSNLAVVYYEKQDYATSLEILTANLGVSRYLYGEMSRFMSVHEKLLLLEDDPFISILLSILEKSSSSLIREYPNLIENLIDRKGFLLRESNNLSSEGEPFLDSLIMPIQMALLETRKLLNLLYQKTTQYLDELGYSIDSLEEIANSYEKEISLLRNTASTLSGKEIFSFENLKTNLNEEEAAIQFFRFNRYEKGWTDSVGYVALLIKKHSSTPEVFFLRDGRLIEEVTIRNYRSAVTSISTSPDDDSAFVYEALTNAYVSIWLPFKNSLKGIKKIYVSLDGELHKINFDAFINPESKSFLSSEVKIHYITSMLEIKQPSYPSHLKSAVLMGYPNFSPDSTTVSKVLAGYEGTFRDAAFTDLSDSIFANNRVTRYFLSSLEGTRKEILESEAIFTAQGFNVKTLIQDHASESNLKTVKRPLILHIATHGFFKSPPDYNASQSHFYGIETKRSISNPMLRSGLFLSGSSTFLNSTLEMKNSYHENGIFTANEASYLDLMGTDIVILSACETGLGEIKNGEGVYGLQRGFLAAGANSVLMSLWKVDDEATYLMITEFNRMYSQGKDKHEALMEAQKIVRTRFPHPFYWAAFIMIGK